MQLEGLTKHHYKCPHFYEKSKCLKHPNEDFVLTREKKKFVEMLKYDETSPIGQRCVLTLSLCVLNIALNVSEIWTDRWTDRLSKWTAK